MTRAYRHRDDDNRSAEKLVIGGSEEYSIRLHGYQSMKYKARADAKNSSRRDPKLLRATTQVVNLARKSQERWEKWMVLELVRICRASPVNQPQAGRTRNGTTERNSLWVKFWAIAVIWRRRAPMRQCLRSSAILVLRFLGWTSCWPSPLVGTNAAGCQRSTLRVSASGSWECRNAG